MRVKTYLCTFLISFQAFAVFSAEIAPTSFSWNTSLQSLRNAGIQFGIEWNGPKPYEENPSSGQVPASIMKDVHRLRCA